MDIISTGIMELFGNEIVFAFRRVAEYLYINHNIEMFPEHEAFIIGLTIQVISLATAFLIAKGLIKWLLIFGEWGVNKLWQR